MPRRPPPTSPVATRLTARDAAQATAEANRRGLTRSGWIAELVRRELQEIRNINAAERAAEHEGN